MVGTAVLDEHLEATLEPDGRERPGGYPGSDGVGRSYPWCWARSADR
ncbi:hypothetical protein [Natrinema pallidum]|nr:hypothetical protein [Natrinema pallidum]